MTRAGDFWSRRKAGVAAEAEAEARAAAAARAAETAAADAARSDEEILDELGLPDPDTLGTGDDFRAFLASAVPEHIRRRALRRLWVSNPVLANLDNLVDYGEDYTDAARAVDVLQTSIKLGRQWLEESDAPEETEAPPAAADEAPATTEGTDAEPLPGDDVAAYALPAVPPREDEPAPVPRARSARRHLQFEFTEDRPAT